jgi:hypothetical protein
MVFLRNSVYAVGGVMGVFIASSWLLSASKWPMIGVRGNSEGSGENGLLEEPMTKPWPLVMSGDGRAGMLELSIFAIVIAPMGCCL